MLSEVATDHDRATWTRPVEPWELGYDWGIDTEDNEDTWDNYDDAGNYVGIDHENVMGDDEGEGMVDGMKDGMKDGLGDGTGHVSGDDLELKSGLGVGQFDGAESVKA